MSIETRIKKIETTFRVGYKPKLFGTPITNWSDKKEAELLKEAIRVGHDLYRPLLGGLSKGL